MVTNNVLDHALELRARGLSIIPIPRHDPERGYDGKTASLRWAEYQRRLPTEPEIRRWFGDGTFTNVAIITGAVSGVIVIDADNPQAAQWCAKRLPYTPWQTRTPRGWHLFYGHPGGRVANRARLQTPHGRLAIDMRADGGYVIVPPSVHVSGAVYQQAGDWSAPREALPRLWPGWLEPRTSTPAVPPRVPGGDPIARARKYLAAIPKPQIGQGSDAATLYAAARLVRGFDLSEGHATALLWEWAGGRPGWTWAWVARKAVHARRYGTEAIGGLV